MGVAVKVWVLRVSAVKAWAMRVSALKVGWI
jgi:hypothetical protein